MQKFENAALPLAVAILNYNGKHWLEAFLHQVCMHSQELAKVYVIDNASTDGSVEYLKSEHPNVICIRNEENSGYTGGYNFGVEKIKEEFIVLLNSDVEVRKGWLQPIANAFQNQPKLAALQPKILDYKRKNHFEYAGGAGGFMDNWGYPFCRGRIFHVLEEDTGQYNQAIPIFWASGACIAVRRSAFWEVGGLDTLFFAHFEEIDLCWRLQRAGYIVAYEPNSTVYHVGGGTLNHGNPRKTFYNFRNNLFVLFKNLPKRWLLPVIVFRLLLDGLAGLLFLVQQKPLHTWAVVRAHFSFYKHFSRLKKARKKLSHLPSPWPITGVYKNSVVLGFYLLNRQQFDQLKAKRFFRF